MKYILFLCVLVSLNCVKAQEVFWAFDTNEKEIPIPEECDGTFNEELGKIVIPTPNELYSIGTAYLFKKGEEQKKASSCLVSAALQGHLEAQYTLAQLYSKGMVLPKNNLAAYKWAFIAGLQGHKSAERLAVSLEQFLSTQDIQQASDEAKLVIQTNPTHTQKTLETLDKELAEKRTYLEEIYAEIDKELHVFIPKDQPKPSLETLTGVDSSTDKDIKNSSVLRPLKTIFTKEDSF